MIRTQIRITPEQAHELKQLAAREGKSVAELIRISIDALLRVEGLHDREVLQRKARKAVGKLNGPENLAANADDFLADAFGH